MAPKHYGFIHTYTYAYINSLESPVLSDTASWQYVSDAHQTTHTAFPQNKSKAIPVLLESHHKWKTLRPLRDKQGVWESALTRCYNWQLVVFSKRWLWWQNRITIWTVFSTLWLTIHIFSAKNIWGGRHIKALWVLTFISRVLPLYGAVRWRVYVITARFSRPSWEAYSVKRSALCGGEEMWCPENWRCRDLLLWSHGHNRHLLFTRNMA